MEASTALSGISKCSETAVCPLRGQGSITMRKEGKMSPLMSLVCAPVRHAGGGVRVPQAHDEGPEELKVVDGMPVGHKVHL